MTYQETGRWENPRNRPNHARDCPVLGLPACEILGLCQYVPEDVQQTEEEAKNAGTFALSSFFTGSDHMKDGLIR